MKTITKLPIAFAILTACTLPGIAVADGHWVLGGAIGTADIDKSIDAFRFDSDSTSYRLFGGYQFNNYFGLEAGYLDLGSFDEQVLVNGTIAPVSADADGFTFAAMGRAPVGEKLALHATIGSFFWDGANMIASVDDNVSDANIFFGVGLSVSLTNNTSIRGDAARYELDEANSNVYTIGFQIDFR